MADKRRAPWWAHVMLYAGGLTMVVAGGAAAVGQYGIHTANTAVDSEEILTDRAEVEDVDNLTGPLDILVLGVDEQGGAIRSDTMIMVHVNRELTEVSMVSLPRDLYVSIPDCGPVFGNNPCENKLNHAASISDDWNVTRANVVATIDDLTGVKFHMAATANFEGFLDLVDMVGQIEMCPWHDITSIHTGKVFEEGCAYYGKDDALDLVRQRKGWGWPSDWEEGRGGDYGRQAMQQQAIKSLLKEAKAQGFHKDPGKLTELLRGFGDSLTLDLPDEVSVTDLVVALRDISPDSINTLRVPAGGEELDDGTSIEVIHEGEEREAADALWAALRNDTVGQWMLAHPEWVKTDA